MMPGWPAFMQSFVGKDFAKKMTTTQLALGFEPEQVEVLNAFMVTQLDALDAHFSEHAFLLGSRPSLGDFGLVGALFAHVGRAEDSQSQWLSTRKHLSDWLDRMFTPTDGGDFVGDDDIPPTLMPAIRSMFDEMLPFLIGCREKVLAAPR